jgi:hypothetical protein
MGRQVGIYARPEDLREFLEFAAARDPLVVTVMDSDRAEIEAVNNPATETRVMTLWNRELVPSLRRRLVKRPTGANYYRIPYSLPVLELSPSRTVYWNRQAALLRGRLYAFAFEGRDAYGQWYEALSRWIRSHFLRNPVDQLDGYIGKAALGWFEHGGILLPAWPKPPITPEWISFVDAQNKARGTNRASPTRSRVSKGQTPAKR